MVFKKKGPKVYELKDRAPKIEEPDVLKNIDRQLRTTVEPEFWFWTADGRTIKDLKELEKVLKTIDDATFKEHVNKSKNDFAEWTKDILKNTALSESLRKAKTRKGAIQVVSRFTKKNTQRQINIDLQREQVLNSIHQIYQHLEGIKFQIEAEDFSESVKTRLEDVMHELEVIQDKVQKATTQKILDLAFDELKRIANKPEVKAETYEMLSQGHDIEDLPVPKFEDHIEENEVEQDEEIEEDEEILPAPIEHEIPTELPSYPEKLEEIPEKEPMMAKPETQEIKSFLDEKNNETKEKIKAEKTITPNLDEDIPDFDHELEEIAKPVTKQIQEEQKPAKQEVKVEDTQEAEKIKETPIAPKLESQEKKTEVEKPSILDHEALKEINAAVEKISKSTIYQERVDEEPLEESEDVKTPEKVESSDEENSFEIKENELYNIEKQLNQEEKELNERKLALAKKRYELIKQRGKLESEKFDYFMSQIGKRKSKKGKKQYVVHDSGKEELFQMLERAAQFLKQNDYEEAKRIANDARRVFDHIILTGDVKKKANYDLTAIETELKLAALIN